MMSLDPQFRSLRGWEQAQPCPPPILADEATDPAPAARARRTTRCPGRAQGDAPLRARRDDGGHRLLGMAVPRAAVHAAGVRLPRVVARHRHDRARTSTTVASSSCWSHDVRPHLWLFKAPHHNFHLEAILAAYPERALRHDAPRPGEGRCRRGRASCRPSSPRPPTVLDLHRLGREVSNHLRIGVEHAIAARARLGEDRFHDVHHRELLADPMGIAARHLRVPRLELTPPVEQTIRDWQVANRGRRPRHPHVHRRAIRPERGAASLRLRVLHRALRRRGRRLTSTERGDTAMSDSAIPAALPSWADQMKALERVSDNLIAEWRPDGATAAETQDMNKLALSILACGYLCRVYTDSRRPGLHAVVELRVQPGRTRPRLRVLDHRSRRRRRLRDLGVPRHQPVRRDHAAGLRHDEPERHERRRPGAEHPRPRR